VKSLVFTLSSTLLLLYPGLANAQETVPPKGVPVTTTVLDQSFPSPDLISPSDGSVTNNPREPFSFRRVGEVASHITLDHYDLYLDGSLLAQGISHTLASTQEYYFYIVERKDEIFNIYPKFDMAEGYHTWNVNAYSTVGVSSGTGTWRFFIDSITPFIKLNRVDNNRLNWDTRDPSTIPPVQNRYVYVNRADPLLTGEVESNANLQFTVICPPVGQCQNINQTFNYPDGTFQYRLYDLIPNQTYSVYLSATDAAGNSSILPVFYLIYSTLPPGVRPTPPVTPTTPAVPPALPPPAPIITPPGLSEIFSPAQFLPVPPSAPTPPPAELPRPAPAFNLGLLLVIILVFGLPLHLAMSQFGTRTDIGMTHKFLFVLLFPFVGRKQHTTYPFTTIEAYDPADHFNTLSHTISDILGQYSLPEKLPPKVLIRAFHQKRLFKPTIFANQLTTLCIFLKLKDHENTLQRLENFSMSKRAYPLIAGILTSSIALFIMPSYSLVIYLYLCLQAGFSEYIYPKINR